MDLKIIFVLLLKCISYLCQQLCILCIFLFVNLVYMFTAIDLKQNIYPMPMDKVFEFEFDCEMNVS